MKRTVLRLIILATLLALILPAGSLAASQGPIIPGQSATPGDYDHWVYLPVIGKKTSFLPPIIPPTTNPLPPETTAGLLSVSPDGVTYTFDTMTPALGAVAPGEIIVAAPSAAAPNGFLRRVTAINATGGDVVVQTQPATLEDAIQQGEVVFSRRLSPEGLAAQELAPGVTLRPSSAVSPQAAFYLEINDVVIYDGDGNPGTTNDQVLVNGSIEFEPTLNFDLRIQQGKIEHLQFTVDARETANLEIEAKLAAAGLKKEKLLGNPIHLQAFVVWVGPVPVVFAPVLTFQIGIDGSVHVGVTTGVTQELTASAGVKYANRTWGPVSGLTNSFTWTPPTLHAGLDLKGYASARLQVLVYGFVGPYASVGPYLKLEADTSRTPWWELYGGLEVPVGVRVDLLGYKEVASYEVLAIGKKWMLAQATTQPPFYLNTYEPYNDGAAGPVSTSGALDSGVSYTVTIWGTFSAWDPPCWANVCKGVPKDFPMFPSPDIPNYKVGVDPAFVFAVAGCDDQSCSAPWNVPTLHFRLEISLDGGTSWASLVPMNPIYDTSHSYTYRVEGQGHPAQFRYVDDPLSDNYGVLAISITRP